ncbi:MAG: flagellin [Lachnospiraceae bacterium]|nr:flagellin [Lachnospiraceae bacterium]
MSSVSGIGSQSIYTQLSTGKKINSAADDAAGLAIAQKLQSQTNGYDVGAENIRDGMSVLNIADGGLDGITDYLQRIRELSVKASNGLYGQQEKQSIQDEIGQCLEGIRQAAKGTEFNTMKLLDGSMADMNIASNPDGSGMEIQMADATLAKLGMEGYDVTGNFDISRVDKALELVTSQRSSMGASMNRLEHAYRSNTNASLQLTSAQSRIEDLDMAKGVTEQKKQDLLKSYQNVLLRKKMQDDSLVLKFFQ